MRRSRKIIFWILFLGILGGLGYFLFGDLGSGSSEDQNKPKEELVYNFSILENDFKEKEITGLYMSPNGRFLVYGIKGLGTKVYDGLKSVEKNISADDYIQNVSFKADRIVITSSDGFYYFDGKTSEITNIPGKVKNAIISEEADLIAFQGEKNMKLYNIKEKTTRDLSFSGFDTPYLWFGDNKRFLGAKDSGKEINSTSHGQTVSIYDTTYGSWMDIETSEDVKVLENMSWTSKGFSFTLKGSQESGDYVSIGVIGEDRIIKLKNLAEGEIYTSSSVYKKVATVSTSSVSVFDSKGQSVGGSPLLGFENLKPVFTFFNTGATLFVIFEDQNGKNSSFEVNTIDGKSKEINIGIKGKEFFVNEEKRSFVFQNQNGIKILNWSEIK